MGRKVRDLQLSTDPNNKKWANDSSAFGYKLLQRMGWREGKGLGAKEDGLVEHVKAKRNLENRGVGCDAKSSDNWLHNASGFSDLLCKLNAAYAQPIPEAAPQPHTLPKHLIYTKRHRAKKVRDYARKDIDAIMGMGAVPATTTSTSEQLADVASTGAEALLVESQHSMDVYFRSKQQQQREQQEDSDHLAADESEPRLAEPNRQGAERRKQRKRSEPGLNPAPIASETHAATAAPHSPDSCGAVSRKRRKRTHCESPPSPAE